jgi:hypothetical protein
VRRVATTLGVSRSQLHERLRHGRKARSRYRKDEDGQLLEPVRRLVDERPTYGYRRIGALLNKERLKAGLPRLNHKRIYRLMAQNGLLLQRYTGRPPGRSHDGRIITIRPNLRWTSDGFEIACWNGSDGLVRQYQRHQRADDPGLDARGRRASLWHSTHAASAAMAVG